VADIFGASGDDRLPFRFFVASVLFVFFFSLAAWSVGSLSPSNFCSVGDEKMFVFLCQCVCAKKDEKTHHFRLLSAYGPCSLGYSQWSIGREAVETENVQELRGLDCLLVTHCSYQPIGREAVETENAQEVCGPCRLLPPHWIGRKGVHAVQGYSIRLMSHLAPLPCRKYG